jgi:hypothetical protein
MEPPEYLHGQAFLGPFAAGQERRYIHAAADRLDEETDRIRAVRDGRYKYLRNFFPERGYYLPLPYREQMPTMQELLRLRDAGALDPEEAQWFRESKPPEELFDTESDPHELHNLAGEPEYAEKLDELRSEYERWAAEVPDYGLMPEAEYLASIWPDGSQPSTAAPVASWSGDELALSSNTEGASMGYQVLYPGEEPGTRWEVYVEPFTVPPDARVVAVAHRIGYLPSGEIFFEWN